MTTSKERVTTEKEYPTFAKNVSPIFGGLIDYVECSYNYMTRKNFTHGEVLNVSKKSVILSAKFITSLCFSLGIITNLKYEVVKLDNTPLSNDLHFVLLSEKENLYIDDIDVNRVKCCLELSDFLTLLITCFLIWISPKVKSPNREYLFLPWLGVSIQGMLLRQGPTAAAVLYTFAIVDNNMRPLFLTVFIFLFLLEARLWVEIARIVYLRLHLYHDNPTACEPQVETLWTNENEISFH